MNDRREFSITDGTEQGERFPSALAPAYFQPEERGFEKLLAMSMDLAAHLVFFDASDNPRGSWGDLFQGDAAAVMAHVLSTDPAGLEAEFISYRDRGLAQGVQFIYGVARTIDSWFTALGRADSRAARELNERFEALAAADLRYDYQRLQQMILQLRGAGESLEGLDFAAFHRFPGGASSDAGASEPGAAEPVATRAEISRLFSSLRGIIASLRSLVPPYLAESLQSSRHEPAIALFMVFLKLLGTANNRLNQFSRRHLDFYYREVLAAEARPKQAEKVFLSLQLAEGQRDLLVPAGTRFVARDEKGGGEANFISERDTPVTPIRVDSLYTLRFERDRYISPETGLGYVTRIKALCRDMQGDADSDWPLFGTSSRLADFKRAQDARIGFAVTSPVLLLREGKRSIDVRVVFKQPQGTPEAQEEHFHRVLRTLLQPPQVDTASFHSLLGDVFRHFVLMAGKALSPEFRDDLVAAARCFPNTDAEAVIEPYLRQEPQAIIQKLFRDVFVISLSVAGGWHTVERFVVTRFESSGASTQRGLRFLLTLGPEIEPIVPCSPEDHGTDWNCSSPVIRFQLNPEASFCAYSLFTDLPLDSIDISVNARGIRGLKLYNNVGPIDPTRPFQPFGPLPTLSSYLAFGSYELAQKQLTEVKVNLEWADLPTCFGGFASHYAGYDRVVREQDIQVDVSVLQDGVWQPQARKRQQTTAPLFQPTGASERLNPAQSIHVGILDFFRPIDASIEEEQFDLRTGTRNGFFRIQLDGPEGAFGHAQYPGLLSRVLSDNIRSKKLSRPVPNAPYTPLLSNFSLDYSARAILSADELRPAESGHDQRILHLHPFGYEEVRPLEPGRSYSLLPSYESDGNLFIGLSACGAGRTLTLFFDLNEETNQQTAFPSPRVSWQYLGNGGWKPLPATNIVSDTSNGFRRSGVLTLILPDDMAQKSSLMPVGKAWIRLGANEYLDSMARLHAVHANTLRVLGSLDEGRSAETVALPPGVNRNWRMSVPLRGVTGVEPVGDPSAGRSAEDHDQFVTRLSERLRHKNRAVTAQDYEQLILERFPDVFKVKCFEGLTAAGFRPCGEAPNPSAGHIMIVVVGDPGEGEGLEHRRPMLNVHQLQDIRSFAQQLSSPFARIQVRNPLYERVQVRCKVKFVGEENPGFYLRRLNRDVSGFLCPWMPYGYQARFGWSIHCEEVEGYIRRCDYVDFVTDFSMLHIAEDADDLYTLADTVSRKPALGAANDSRVRWRYPWSLAVPMERHFIESLLVSEPVAPEPTGIGELDIGSTFIIGGNP